MFREKLEAVTVCVGYADFLEEVVGYNKSQFDRWVIVTAKDDDATRHVCRKHRLQCLTTEDHKRDGDFNKGRMVERGLQLLSGNSWILHLDADIVLPCTFRHDLERAHLKDDAIHGFDRFMVEGQDEWERLKRSGWLHQPYGWHPNGVGIPEGFPLGSRWAGGDGWVPIGFAQLWHRIGGGEEWCGHRTKTYPIDHGTACRTDVQHSLQWDRRDRILVPEIFVAHLGSEDNKNGINWNGRKSAPFKTGGVKMASASVGPS